MDKQQVYKILNEAYFSEKPHQAESLPAMVEMLRGAQLFVDVGASLGQFTRLASRSMLDGEIIAIEADPIRFEELARNCDRWAAESGCSIRPIHAAVGAVSGTVCFQTTESNVSGGLVRHDIAPGHAAVTWSEIEVRSATLDELCRERIPNVIKMDIEGAELDALKGARGLLSKRQTRLVVEVHTFKEIGGESNRRAVANFMKGLGYASMPFYGQTFFFPRGSVPFYRRMHLRLQWLRHRIKRKLLSDTPRCVSNVVPWTSCPRLRPMVPPSRRPAVPSFLSCALSSSLPFSR